MELQILSRDQISKLHNASLEILSTIGVRVPHAEMRARFRAAGANVDDDAELVKIPEALVRQIILRS